MTKAESIETFHGLTIAHLSDLDDVDSHAFMHAVALARVSGSTLLSLHANDEEAVESRMPHATELLVRWGALPANAAPGDEEKLGMKHSRLVDSTCDDVVDTLLSMLQRVRPNLIVASTSARKGLSRALLGSVATAISQQATVPTLLLPPHVRPFVAANDGALSLRRILVAAEDQPAATLGSACAIWLARLTHSEKVEVELYHVGNGPLPDVPFVPPERVSFRLTQTTGEFEEQFDARARGWPADLVVLATRGHDSARDVLFGNHTEHLLARATCPVLCIRI